MSNSTANRNAATRCSAEAGNVAPHAASSREAEYHRQIAAIVQEFFMYGIESPVACLCDMLNHSVELPDIAEPHLRNLVFESTRLIRFVVELGEKEGRRA